MCMFKCDCRTPTCTSHLVAEVLQNEVASEHTMRQTGVCLVVSNSPWVHATWTNCYFAPLIQTILSPNKNHVPTF